METTQIQKAVAWADIILSDILKALRTVGLTFLLAIALVLVFWLIEVLKRRLHMRRQMKERDDK
jgi:predicted benzoate:H+ symporter BenE